MKLIKLFKDNCPACVQMSNLLESLEVEVNEEYDVMRDTSTAMKYGAMSVPVLILEDDEGNEVSRSVGFKPNEIQELIAELDN